MGLLNTVKKGVEGLNAGHSARPETGIIRKAINAVGGFISSAVYNVGYGLGRIGLKSPLKIAGIGAVVLAAVGAVVALVGGSRSRREKESQRELMRGDTDAMRAEVAAMQGQNTLMGMEPVEGQHARRVRAGRGERVSVPDAANINPDISLPYEVVR